jgi:hypothetical protein
MRAHPRTGATKVVLTMPETAERPGLSGSDIGNIYGVFG